MKAELLLRRRYDVHDAAFAEIRIWRVPSPVRGSVHDFKYSLALVVDDVCILRYDNEAGKGDHRHVDGIEEPYRLTTSDDLIADFERDIEDWRSQ